MSQQHEFDSPERYATTEQIELLADTALLKVALYGSQFPEDKILDRKDGIPVIPESVSDTTGYFSSLELSPEKLSQHVPHAFERLRPTRGLKLSVSPANYVLTDAGQLAFESAFIEIFVRRHDAEVSYSFTSEAEPMEDNVWNARTITTPVATPAQRAKIMAEVAEDPQRVIADFFANMALEHEMGQDRITAQDFQTLQEILNAVDTLV